MKKLGFGMMRLPLIDENSPTSINQEMVNKMADYFMEKGFTYFDTAYPYHQGVSEIATRKAIVERYPRESFQLANKMPVWLVNKYEDYQKIFDEQLEKCGVEYFDYYLLHALNAKTYTEADQNGGFEFMQDLKRIGKIKNICISFHDRAELLERILTEHPEIECVQLQINYMDWESESIESRKCYEIATAHKKPVIVMEPIKGGILAKLPEKADSLIKDYNSEMSAASWAIRFAASLENVFMVLSGMSNFDHMEDNASYMENFQALSVEENKIIEQVIELTRNDEEIPCTACQYCVDDCPKKIAIPKYFAIYNERKRFGKTRFQDLYYNNLAQTFGKASECVSCQQCEKHCPQHINIIEELKKVAAEFEE